MEETITQQKETIEEILIRYKNWLTAGTWASGYWKNREVWEREIQIKVNELEKKLKLTK